jgi:hypothetical protein
MLMNRTFGVEIEFFGCTREAVANEITRRGVKCEVQGYNHTDSTTTWKLVTDSSVTSTGTGNYRGGNEIVSPILEGENGLKQLQIVCESLNACGAKVDKTCGIHVHLDAADLTVQNWKNIILTYAKYQDTINGIMPISRRHNNYCETYSDYLVARYMNATTLNELVNITTRYHVINTEAYLRHSTIEFRQHSGSTEYDKIASWIQFLMAFVQYTKTMRKSANNEKLTSSLANQWMNLMDNLVKSGLDKEVRSFYAKRRNELAKKIGERVA